jgi:hypothetical protein
LHGDAKGIRYILHIPAYFSFCKGGGGASENAGSMNFFFGTFQDTGGGGAGSWWGSPDRDSRPRGGWGWKLPKKAENRLRFENVLTPPQSRENLRKVAESRGRSQNKEERCHENQSFTIISNVFDKVAQRRIYQSRGKSRKVAQSRATSRATVATFRSRIGLLQIK